MVQWSLSLTCSSLILSTSCFTKLVVFCGCCRLETSLQTGFVAAVDSSLNYWTKPDLLCVQAVDGQEEPLSWHRPDTTAACSQGLHAHYTCRQEKLSAAHTLKNDKNADFILTDSSTRYSTDTFLVSVYCATQCRNSSNIQTTWPVFSSCSEDICITLTFSPLSPVVCSQVTECSRSLTSTLCKWGKKKKKKKQLYCFQEADRSSPVTSTHRTNTWAVSRSSCLTDTWLPQRQSVVSTSDMLTQTSSVNISYITDDPSHFNNCPIIKPSWAEPISRVLRHITWITHLHEAQQSSRTSLQCGFYTAASIPAAETLTFRHRLRLTEQGEGSIQVQDILEFTTTGFSRRSRAQRAHETALCVWGWALPEESEAQRPEDERPPEVHFGSRFHVVLTSKHQGGVQSTEHKRLTPATKQR